MFKVLDAHDDAVEWRGWVNALPFDLRDVHVSPEWGQCQDHPAKLAVYYDGRTTATMMPFCLRRVPGGGGAWFDAIAAGFGGPMTNCPIPARTDGNAFLRAFGSWAEANGIVSEFYLINPAFAESQALLVPSEQKLERGVIMVPVTGDDAELLKQMRPNRKHSLKQAADAHVSIIGGTVMSDMYQAAMERLGAPARWQLGAHYFARLERLLGDRAAILGAFSPDGDLKAGAVFLFGTSVAYYHLAATAPDRANGYADRLVLEGMRLARSKGVQWMHLGGGRTSQPDDSLLAYKRSFGGFTRPTYSVRQVHNRRVYDELSRGLAPTGYFPAYRQAEAE